MFKVGFICTGYENLGIEYLSARLLQNGYRTRLFLDPILFDESGFIRHRTLAKWFSHDAQIVRSIKEYKPDLICLSVLSDNYQWTCKWTSLIKANMKAPIVVGGIHPSSVPESVIQNKNIDYLCVGEGDDAIVDLARVLSEKKHPRNIKNIWCKDNGSTIQNEVRPLISDLNNLPFADKDLFYSNIPAWNRNYSIITSRGCPFACSYCCNNVLKSIYNKEKNGLRRRSVENIIAELLHAKDRYAPEHIAFIDEVFNFDKEWLLTFLKEYRSKIALPFSCFIFPDLMDDEMARCLKKAGCDKVQMGVQMIDENKRSKLMHRNSSNTKITQCITACKEAGIYVVCDIILGFPQTDNKDLAEAVKFFGKSTPDHIEIFWLRYYPKTEISEWALEQGHLTTEDYQLINEGLVVEGIIRGHSQVSKLEKKLVFFLYLIPILPDKCKKYLIGKKRYRYLPSWISIMSLYILKRLIRRPKYDINTDQTISRYIKYTFKKLNPINWKFARSK